MAELANGATKIAGGLDGGTAAQKGAASGLAHRLSLINKELQPQVVSDTNASLT